MQNLNGTDFLGLMIENPSRWGFTFESLVRILYNLIPYPKSNLIYYLIKFLLKFLISFN